MRKVVFIVWPMWPLVPECLFHGRFFQRTYQLPEEHTAELQFEVNTIGETNTDAILASTPLTPRWGGEIEAKRLAHSLTLTVGSALQATQTQMPSLRARFRFNTWVGWGN
jgi:hypothetical protein